MIYVDYSYLRKSDGRTVHATAEFYSPKKANRFIRSIIRRKDISYDGFSCDESDECDEMNRLL